MPKLTALFFFLLLTYSMKAQTYTESEGKQAWQTLKEQPITEASFRKACDLMQSIGKTNLKQSYEMLAEYVPLIRATGNRQWLHVLMMGWARAKESTGYFDDAEQLYHQVLNNTRSNERYYREAIAAIALMYGEWGKIDSLDKYADIGMALCEKADDKENLSFLYCFKAMTRSEDTAAMHRYFIKAIELATDIPDKNALFTARYNYAYVYWQTNLQQQVKEFEALLEIAKDTSLNRYPNRLYDRTAFTFRNAKPSVYYNLMQINLVLTDYDNAWKFAELFYDATIKPNPASINAPYFNAEMAIAKAYQEDFAAAKGYLDKSRAQFNMPEDSIPYISYFIAAGMLAENARQNERALHYYASALQKGNTQSQHMIPPEIYYARMLIKTGNINEAEKVLSKFQTIKETRKYSAIGLNYYHDYAELLSRKNDNNGYVQALKTYYSIKDSLTNLNRYRAIQQMQATVLLQNREQQIAYLHHESAERTKQARRERLFYILLIALAGAIILLLVMYLRNRQIRSRQQQALQQNKLDQMEKQRDIELMQSMMQAEENERHKIADQLHNEVNAMLALAQLNVSSAIENSGDEQATKKLSKAHEAISTVSSTIRDLSHRLTPLIIEKFGFRKAIEDMAEAINISEKIKVETVIVGFEDQARHPVPLQNDIYRIIQELLHNILKHSVATSATIQVVEHENNISIIVEDNGIGIDEGNKLKGKGLDAIRSKVTFLKGHVEISRKKEGGTLVVMEIAT